MPTPPENRSVVKVFSQRDLDQVKAFSQGVPQRAKVFAQNLTDQVTTLGAIQPSGIFDPATLPLTFWVRGPYSGVPWSGRASAGASAGNGWDTVSIADPTIGPSLNGINAATFNGVNQDLTSLSFIDNIFQPNSASGTVLFYANAAQPDTGATTWYDMPSLISSDASTRFGLVFSTSGVRFGTFSAAGGGFWNSIDAAASTGAWHLAQFFHDGVNLNLRVDSGAWQQLARGATSFSHDLIASGHDPDTNTVFYNGFMMEWILSDQVFSNTDFTNIKSYTNATYSLSL